DTDGFLPPLDRVGRGGVPDAVGAEGAGTAVAEGHEVLLELLDVGAAPVGPERPPGGAVAVEERHLVPVDLVEGLSALDGRAGRRQPGQRAHGAVDHRHGVAVAEGAVDVGLLDEGAAGDLGRVEAGPAPVLGLGAAAGKAGHRQPGHEGQGGAAGDDGGRAAAGHLAPPPVEAAPPPNMMAPRGPSPFEAPSPFPPTEKEPPLAPAGPKADPQACWASSNLGSDGSMPLSLSIFIIMPPPSPKVGSGMLMPCSRMQREKASAWSCISCCCSGVMFIGPASPIRSRQASLASLNLSPSMSIGAAPPLPPSPLAEAENVTTPSPLVSGSGMSTPCSRMQRAKASMASSGLVFLPFLSLSVLSESVFLSLAVLMLATPSFEPEPEPPQAAPVARPAARSSRTGSRYDRRRLGIGCHS